MLCVDDGGRAEVGGSSGTEVRDEVVCGGAGEERAAVDGDCS